MRRGNSAIESCKSQTRTLISWASKHALSVLKIFIYVQAIGVKNLPDQLLQKLMKFVEIQLF